MWGPLLPKHSLGQSLLCVVSILGLLALSTWMDNAPFEQLRFALVIPIATLGWYLFRALVRWRSNKRQEILDRSANLWYNGSALSTRHKRSE